jgi:hypothetical protein
MRAESWKLWTLVAGLAAVLAAGIAVVIVAPWSTRGNRPIRHAFYQYVRLGPQKQPGSLRVELATGHSAPLKTTNEIWFDKRSGLFRVQIRSNSSLLFDGVGTSCSPGEPRKPCLRFGITPFLEVDQYKTAFEQGRTRKLGEGMLDGYHVLWVARVYRGKGNTSERAALDAQTHELRAVRQLVNGRPFSQENVTLLDDIPAGSVRFPIPRGGAPWGSVPPALPLEMDLGSSRISAVRHLLSPSPLWVGRRFSGLVLSSLDAGAAKVKGVNGVTLASVPYVRLTYGADPPRQLILEEFNATPKVWLRHQGFFAPPAGYLDLYSGQSGGTVGRGRVVVRMSAPTKQATIEAARALKPIPAAG